MIYCSLPTLIIYLISRHDPFSFLRLNTASDFTRMIAPVYSSNYTSRSMTVGTTFLAKKSNGKGPCEP